MSAHFSIGQTLLSFFLLAMISLSCAAKFSVSRQKLEVQKHLNCLNKFALKTIQSPAGYLIDRVHISHQSAFDHPLLQDHKIQMRPNFHPEGRFDENKVSIEFKEKTNPVYQLWHINGKCPEDTIPIKRTKKDHVLKSSSIIRYGRKKHRTIPKPKSTDPELVNQSGHQAIAYVEDDKFYGAKAMINACESRIQQANEFSLSQIWILGGSFYKDLNSIEAGWKVCPDLYGHNNTRLFTYWTVPEEGNWWMQFGNVYVLGYWPSFLFSYLSGSASMIEWGGEVVNSEQDGEHTSTQMGSGHFSEEGFGSKFSLLALFAASQYYKLDRKPPVTAALVAANTLIYLGPYFLGSILPTIDEVSFNPHLIVKNKDLKRFLLSSFYHLHDAHLLCNMMSLLWIGIRLECSMGSVEFTSMIATLLGMSQGMKLLLARSLMFFGYERPYYSAYSIGFSSVLFAMLVIHNSQLENLTPVYILNVLARHSEWFALILTPMFVPNVSIVGHLGGILAGILYLRLKASQPGSNNPLTKMIKGLSSLLTWSLRRLRRRNRTSGRGTVGRDRDGLDSLAVWSTGAYTFVNSDGRMFVRGVGREVVPVNSHMIDIR